MIDHLTIRVTELGASRDFYRRSFALLAPTTRPTESGDFVEWADFSILRAESPKRATRRLHVAFQAASTAAVDGWWEALTGEGYPDDGRPGPRPECGPAYYGASLRDPDGSSVEAVHGGAPRADGTRLDHLWLRVRDLETATLFYELVTPVVGYATRRLRGRSHVNGDGASFSLVEGEPTENVHLAFSSPDRSTVERFHEAGVRAGYASLGEPGERPWYHTGYYGAYLADPDGNNIEAVHHDRPAVS